MYTKINSIYKILLTKTTAVENEVALSYHRMRGLYFLAVVFASTIESIVSTVQLLLNVSKLISILSYQNFQYAITGNK